LTWKKKYIPYYHILEDILGKLVPKLTSEEICNFVSNEDWMLVPTEKESGIDDGKTRKIPNMYFALRENSIGIGIVCHTIPSINFFKNITHDFHSEDKKELSTKLLDLNDNYITRLARKIKNNNFAQSPEYETVLEFQTNTLNTTILDELIDLSDKIREEGREIRKQRKISWPPHTPAIYLLRTEIPKTNQDFIDTIKTIKPIYEIILNIKPEKEIKRILSKQERQKEDQEKKKYHDFVVLLNKTRSLGYITAKERRDLDKKWNEDPDLRNEIETDLTKFHER